MEQKKECKHKNKITRKNGSFYCKDCGYDSKTANPSGKLTRVIKELAKCRNSNKELAETFSKTVGDLQKRLEISRKSVREKTKEIKELKAQIEAMINE